MRARNSGPAVRSLITALVLLGAAAPARGGTFLWQNASGGSWDQPSNWGSTSYPRFFFDFALFALDTPLSVDAADPTRVTPVGIIMVDRGHLSLATHEGFGGVISVGNGSQPASMQLLSGAISAAGVHTVASHGTLFLASGTALRSSAPGEVGLSIMSGGRLEGEGTALDGRTLRNGGVVAPGQSPGAAGILTLGISDPAAYQQMAGGMLEVDLGSADPGTGYDQLRVEQARGPVLLDGTLRVTIREGFVPGAESRYVVIEAPAIQGTFATVEWPEVAGVTFSLDIGSSRVEVVARSAVAVEACFSVQPGSLVGSLGLGGHGVLPTAILDTDGVPASAVDPVSVRLAGVAPLRWGYEDVGGACDDGSPQQPDGREDLTLKFDAGDILATLTGGAHGDTVALALEGTLVDGSAFVGTGLVVLRGSKGRKGRSAGEAVSGLAVRSLGDSGGSTRSLSLALPTDAPVQVLLFDISGRLVREIHAGFATAGNHRLDWEPRDLASGIYFYRVASGGAVATAPMTMVR